MATAAQIAANRQNAQASTGPVSEAGKAAVAQNSTSQGLTSRSFALLPNEDPAAFENLLAALEAEHAPNTPTESFLVLELARAQWKIERINAIETEILSGTGEVTDWSTIAARFVSGDSVERALAKLSRYEQSARRAWYQALNQILKLRKVAEDTERRRAVDLRRDQDAFLEAFLEPPIPMPRPQPAPETRHYEAKPIPAAESVFAARVGRSQTAPISVGDVIRRK